MAEHPTAPRHRQDGHREDGGASDGPVVRDRRRLDPATGQVRPTAEPAHGTASQRPEEQPVTSIADAPVTQGVDAELAAARTEVAERLDDLRRLSAEFANYRRRVERDAAQAREAAVAQAVEGLLPVLDDIELARQHGDLTGPFGSVGERLEQVLGALGLQRYGEVGDPFDPTIHDALMHSHRDDVEVTTCIQILQPGYRLGERVLRPARVAVADPVSDPA